MARSIQPIMISSEPNTARWRYQFNPLRGITLQRLVEMLNLAEMGFYPDLQWLYRYIEKRDATLLAVKNRRMGALKKLDWSIKIKDKFSANEKLGTPENPLVAAQMEALTEAYDGIDNMKEAVEFLALAAFRGFAHLEKHYHNDMVDEGVHHLEKVEQWYWLRRMPDPQWFYNKHAANSSFGSAINPDHFIIREVDSPIDEIASIAFLRKNMSQKDWDGFVETFGIPPLFIELPQGTGAGNTDEFQELVEQIIGDSRGVLPNGARVQSITDGQRGGRPFEEHIRYQDEQVVMAATGGLLTALAEATGMNSGNSENHADAFSDIASGEAVLISEAFQRQFDHEVLMRKFPMQEEMVYFELEHESMGDDSSKVIQDAGGLASAGFKMEKADLEERTGYKLVESEAGGGMPGMDGPPGADGGGPPGMNPMEKMAQPDEVSIGEEPGNFSNALSGILNGSDEKLSQSLDEISDRAGRFLNDAGVDARKALKLGDSLAKRLEKVVK